MINLLLLLCIFGSGALLAAFYVLMEGVAGEWRHDRAERRMVARVERARDARRRLSSPRSLP